MEEQEYAQTPFEDFVAKDDGFEVITAPVGWAEVGVERRAERVLPHAVYDGVGEDNPYMGAQ